MQAGDLSIILPEIILSVFAMTTMVGGPFGSLMIGFLIDSIGVLNAVLFPPIALIFVWVGMFLFTNLWQIETDAPIAHADYADTSPS